MLGAAGGILEEMKCHQREIQNVGVLIKSVSDCELLKHAYLELACLIGCVCVCVCVGGCVVVFRWSATWNLLTDAE